MALSVFLTKLLLLPTLGVVLDAILVGKEEREKISKYLSQNHNDNSLTERFNEFLKISHSAIFGRFFSNKLLSWPFFRSAALVSLFSFTSVACVQLYFYSDGLQDVLFDSKQLIIILAFVIFNVAFDYMTIIQSKIFIEAAISTKSIFRGIVIIFSDLIVTMNSHILMYSCFIMIFVQFFVWPTKDFQFIRDANDNSLLSSMETPPDYLSRIQATNIAERLRYNGIVTGLLTGSSSPEDNRYVTILYESSIDPSTVDLAPLLLSAISRMSVSVGASFVEIDEDRTSDLVEQFQNELTFSRLLRRDQSNSGDTDEGDQQTNFESLSVSANGSISSIAELDAAYTIAFNHTDMLEDSFPISIFANLEFLPLGRLVADTMSNELGSPPIMLCIIDDGTIYRAPILRDNKNNVSNCAEVVSVDFIWHHSLTRSMSVADRDVEGRVVPFNTLLVTSLLPTFAFYVIIIFMAVSTFLFSYLFRGTKKARKYLLRAPFAVAGFVLGLPLVLLGWL